MKDEISKFEYTRQHSLFLPLNDKGQPYSIEALYPEQQKFLYVVLEKIREWMTCEDLSVFVPGRYTVQGQGGTGKSVLNNTLVSVLRSLFEYNNVACPGGPTGGSAFNILGETLHRLSGQGITGEYQPFTLSEAKKQALQAKFKHLLCLIIDERSLLTSKLLGSTAQIISETIFDGCNIDEILGGLPVIILTGDDYQLPGMSEGAFQVLTNTGGSKMTMKGRQLLRDCSKNVFKLKINRRVSDVRQDDKDMLQRIRLGVGITDADVSKLQSLHLDNIRDVHGPDVVKRIEKDALYLFWTNEKRIKLNLSRLIEVNSSDNPTAIIKPVGTGSKFGKSIQRHFKTNTPSAAMLCKGAKVCIQGCNFNPIWGLHNRACGTVQEIVFAPGKNPNKGDQPKYVVVHFPQYKGPAWDIDRPKVKHNLVYLINYSVHLTEPSNVLGCTYSTDNRTVLIQMLPTHLPTP